MNKKKKEAEVLKDSKGNTGKNNTGEGNSGNWNSGYRNSGDWNSGDSNSGDRNSGHRNSGDRNSGHRNSGDSNSGYMNSGDWNSGDWNLGNRNSGDWNSGDWNSGFLNTNKPKVRIFNKETDVEREDIIFPDYFYFNLTQDGYKEAWKDSFETADKEDVAKTLELPNFDYEIFEEITGITKEMIDKKLGKGDIDSKPKSIIIDGVEYIKKQEVEK